jgi:hypothetical protein
LLSKEFSAKVTDEYDYLPARIFVSKGFPLMRLESITQAFFNEPKVDNED